MSSFGIQSLVVDNRRKFQFTHISFYGVYECIMNVLNNPQYLSESFNLSFYPFSFKILERTVISLAIQ